MKEKDDFCIYVTEIPFDDEDLSRVAYSPEHTREMMDQADKTEVGRIHYALEEYGRKIADKYATTNTDEDIIRALAAGCKAIELSSIKDRNLVLAIMNMMDRDELELIYDISEHYLRDLFRMKHRYDIGFWYLESYQNDKETFGEGPMKSIKERQILLVELHSLGIGIGRAKEKERRELEMTMLDDASLSVDANVDGKRFSGTVSFDQGRAAISDIQIDDVGAKDLVLTDPENRVFREIMVTDRGICYPDMWEEGTEYSRYDITYVSKGTEVFSLHNAIPGRSDYCDMMVQYVWFLVSGGKGILDMKYRKKSSVRSE